MANLKAIAIRLKSVKNIQKITQSMKMVSAAKYARAERDLKAARPYGVGAQSFYKNAQVGWDAKAGQKELYVALTFDRGLYGHGRIGKHRKRPGGRRNAGGQHHHRIKRGYVASDSHKVAQLGHHIQ